jgi:hypothetical protein
MAETHEVDGLSDHVDHFGVSVVADQIEMSSDILVCEGRLFTRL